MKRDYYKIHPRRKRYVCAIQIYIYIWNNNIFCFLFDHQIPYLIDLPFSPPHFGPFEPDHPQDKIKYLTKIFCRLFAILDILLLETSPVSPFLDLVFFIFLPNYFCKYKLCKNTNNLCGEKEKNKFKKKQKQLKIKKSKSK